MTRPEVRHIGTDRVVLEDDRLLVVSRVDMDGWDVRRHRAAVIRFDGRTWRVAGKTFGADQAIQYELVPWQPRDEELTGPEIDYTADYVAVRDQTRTAGRRRGRVTAGLRILSPLAGFLPARTKGRLEAVYGLDPMAATFQSVFLEFLITLAALTLAAIGSMSRSISVAPALAIAVVVAMDGVVRWERILNEERPPPGFYEWMIKRRR